MSYHTIHRWRRFAWTEHEKHGREFMWSSTGTYHHLFWNLWWFCPSSDER